MTAVCVWDFTLPAENIAYTQVLEVCKEIAKKFAFQKEKGESGYIHYQGRLSLKMKKRMAELKGCFPVEMQGVHLSPTTTENRDNLFYVTKLDSRVEGPWTDETIIVPARLKRALLPWQQAVMDSVDTDSDRTINILVDKVGGTGKSYLKMYVGAHKLGVALSPMESHKDLMRQAFCKGESRLYLVDLPRAWDKNKLSTLFSAVEELKNGYCCEDRYRFQELFMEQCPAVWVFTNVDPSLSMLSKDRWKFWCIGADKELLPYEPEVVEEPEKKKKKL
jgi:hypothetical protein